MSHRARRSAAAIAVAGALAGVALPGAAVAASGYCSPSGDQCYSARRVAGAWRLLYGTFALRGSVEACVTTPAGATTCAGFRLRERRGLYSIDARWSRHFPVAGRGTYRVRWRQGGVALGPAVTFRR